MKQLNLFLVIVITVLATTLFLIIITSTVMNIYGIVVVINSSERVTENESVYKEVLCPDNCVSPSARTNSAQRRIEAGTEYPDKIVDKEVVYSEKCVMPSDFECIDFSGDESGIILVIQNNADFEVRDVKVTIKFPDVELVCTDSSGDSTLMSDEIETFTCSGPLYFGQHIGKINIDYVSSKTTLAHSKSGDVIMDVSLDKVDNSPLTPP